MPTAIVAGLVRAAVDPDAALGDLTDDELHAASPHSTTRSATVLAQRSWLESKVSEGGTVARRAWREQLAAARALLSRDAATDLFDRPGPRRRARPGRLHGPPRRDGAA